MSWINEYKAVNPVFNKEKPFLGNHNQLIIPMKGFFHKFYMIAARDDHLNERFFILFGYDKFDDNAREIKKDDYGRLKVNLNGNFKNFVKEQLSKRKNLDLCYTESKCGIDIYEFK